MHDPFAPDFGAAPEGNTLLLGPGAAAAGAEWRAPGLLGAGRGAGAAAPMWPAPALGAGLPPAAGRGRGRPPAGGGRAAPPRITMAALSEQIMAGFAGFEARLVALEIAPPPLAAPVPQQAQGVLAGVPAQAVRVPALIGTLPKVGGLAPPEVGAPPPGLCMGMPPMAPHRMGGKPAPAGAAPATPK